MKTLPKYWAVKTNTSHPIFEKFYNWIRIKAEIKEDFYNKRSWYYWFDGSKWINWYRIGAALPNAFTNPVTLITLEEWNECINGAPSKEYVTYKIQYVGSDWTLLEKDSINGKPIEEFREEYNRMRRLLSKHKECLKS